MVASITNAISAYSKTNTLPEINSIGATEGKKAGGFEDVLEQVATDAVEQMKSAEQISVKGAMGKANPVEIATAVAGAESTLQMLTVVREKMIAAYQEMSRMSV